MPFLYIVLWAFCMLSLQRFTTYLLDIGLHQKLNMKVDFCAPETSAYVCTRTRETDLHACVYVISFTSNDLTHA